MSDNTITIGDTTFDRINYDRDADVLYLSVGDPRPAAHTYGTPEGHAVRYDADGMVTGITITNARHLFDRNELVITVPQAVDVRRDEIELALH
jgi:uncharacterized protein YuzE